MNKETVRNAVEESLSSLGVLYFVEEESGAVVVPLPVENEDDRILIVFDIFDDYFILLGIIPAEVDPEDEDEMIRFVNMANADLLYGRFVYDDEEADVQYRLAYLGSKKRISRELVREYFKAAYSTIICYRDGILDVCYGASAEDAYYGLKLDDEEPDLAENQPRVPEAGTKKQESKILRPFEKSSHDYRRD